MQIGTSSLLAAQQARLQPSPTPRAAANPPKAEAKPDFEPLTFAARAPEAPPAPLQSAAQPAQPRAFQRPGSQIDIKI